LRGGLSAWPGRRPRLFHGRGTVAAATAYVASRATGALFFNDADGPLSEEYVDAGIWSRDSLTCKLVSRTEMQCIRRANAVAVLTQQRRNQVIDWTAAPVDVLPCGIDTSLFVRDEQARLRLRARMKLEGTVLIYVGKFRGWYLGDRVVEFAAAAKRAIGNVSLLVLTPESPVPFERRAAELGVRCIVRNAAPTEVPRWLSVADAGLSLRKALPSQASSSPIKNGEYLACGLPIVTTSGVGDYTRLIVERNVGVLIERFDDESLLGAARALRGLLQDAETPMRCRDAARENVGLAEIVIPRYRRIYRRLLGSPSSDSPEIVA
jgi:glycosyltransferase involved in cell wall biosynthesis